jgi:co-chaperonin GroES (HSP10)
MGGYKPKGEVRSYGVYGEFPGNPQATYWWDSVIAVYNDRMVRPVGDKIIFRADEGTDKQGSILLLNKKSTAMATVESVGPFEQDIKPGDRVCYDPYHIEQVGVLVDDVVDYGLSVGSALSVVYVLDEVAA